MSRSTSATVARGQICVAITRRSSELKSGYSSEVAFVSAAGGVSDVIPQPVNKIDDIESVDMAIVRIKAIRLAFERRA